MRLLFFCKKISIFIYLLEIGDLTSFLTTSYLLPMALKTQLCAGFRAVSTYDTFNIMKMFQNEGCGCGLISIKSILSRKFVHLPKYVNKRTRSMHQLLN